MEETNSSAQENNPTEQNGLEKEVKSSDEPAKNVETEQEKEQPNNDDSSTEKKEEPSIELLDKIKKQVEFYFGDVNMQRDRFLIEQTRLDDGWVPMTVMLNFKILASLSKDIEVILKSLENSDLIEISEDRKKIRRSSEKPLPTYDDNYRKAQEARTIYLKGFPTDSTIETLKKYFESTEAIESIIMRKYKKGKEYFFKGSIFLQFKTLEDAKTFMEQESVKFNDTELLKLWSADYTASKEKERDERRLKKLKNQISQKTDNGKGSKNQKGNIQDKVKIPKGCVIHFTNTKKEIPRENIKQKLVELEGEVAYVDFNTGDIEGWIRLQGENSAVEFLKKLDSNVIKLDDCDLTCKLLEGEEEETYFNKIRENMTHHRLNRREKGRNGRKNFKRRHSPHRDGNTKRIHVDDS